MRTNFLTKWENHPNYTVADVNLSGGMAHASSTPPYVWRRLKALTVPILGVRAELSDLIPKASWDKWRRLREQDDFVVLPGIGHMAPLEAPRKTARMVAGWLHSRPTGD